MAIGVKVPILSEFNSKGFKAAYAEFKKLETTSQRIGFLMKKAFSPAGLTAMAGAATGAAYAALNMAKAAAEDARQQTILASALKNTVGATDDQIAATEQLISKMQMAYGVSDGQLRVGFQNLARATEDLTKSEQLLGLALDISVATGKDLETVTLALGKAYTGNVGALTRLGIPLDEATKKSKDFEAIVAKLGQTFGGAASANADTLAGQMAILSEKFGEAQEELGVKLIPVLTDLVNILSDLLDVMDAVGGVFQAVENDLSDFGKGMGEIASIIPGVGSDVENLADRVYRAAGELNIGAFRAEIFANELEGVWDALNYGKEPLNWMITVGLPNLNAHLNALGYDTTVRATSGLGGFTREVEAAEPPLVRYARALQETQAQLAGTVTGMLDLGAAASKPGVSNFVQGVMGQATQIKNLAKNLTTLGERGLNPAAIQGIMSLDLGTAASLAQDLVNSAYSTRMIKNLNRAYGTISTAATQFGTAMGGYMMTGGSAPVTQHITITNPNPQAVVKALRDYGRTNGPIQIATTGSF